VAAQWSAPASPQREAPRVSGAIQMVMGKRSRQNSEGIWILENLIALAAGIQAKRIATQRRLCSRLRMPWCRSLGDLVFVWLRLARARTLCDDCQTLLAICASSFE
jgi:hypothetical protein